MIDLEALNPETCEPDIPVAYDGVDEGDVYVEGYIAALDSPELGAILHIAMTAKDLIVARRAYLDHLVSGVALDERDALQAEMHHATGLLESLVRRHLLEAQRGDSDAGR